MKKTIFTIILLLFTLFLVSCNTKRYEYIEGKINVTATTNIMGDLAFSIGGNKVSVYNLMDAGVDPHSYIPRPGDYNALGRADIILVSGLHLEAQMGEIFNEYQSIKPIINIGQELLASNLGSRLIESSEFGGNYDPHFWFDITLYKKAAEIFAAALIDYDPINKDYYLINLSSYLEQLDDLSNKVFNQLKQLGSTPRILVSAHDAFSYLELEHNFKVYALQGLSTEDEISPSDIIEIATIVIENNVSAIFPETSVPIETITALSEAILNHKDGFEITIGGKLYSDSMGNSNDDNTYLKMYLKNINTIVDALLESRG
ncbi:MAG TPA: zinc ABC transporter solute-binding protein [Acholeplasmataceae bacterium]|nr:zinc ABC transporter solute-binding protein [Acholeplasmataceae bacterium]